MCSTGLLELCKFFTGSRRTIGKDGSCAGLAKEARQFFSIWQASVAALGSLGQTTHDATIFRYVVCPSLQHISTKSLSSAGVLLVFLSISSSTEVFFINYCTSCHFNHQRLKTVLREICLLLSLIHTLKEVLVNLLSVFLWNKHVSLVQLLLWSYKRRSKYVTDFNSSNFSLKFCPSQQARNQPHWFIHYALSRRHVN